MKRNDKSVVEIEMLSSVDKYLYGREFANMVSFFLPKRLVKCLAPYACSGGLPCPGDGLLHSLRFILVNLKPFFFFGTATYCYKRKTHDP